MQNTNVPPQPAAFNAPQALPAATAQQHVQVILPACPRVPPIAFLEKWQTDNLSDWFWEVEAVFRGQLSGYEKRWVSFAAPALKIQNAKYAFNCCMQEGATHGYTTNDFDWDFFKTYMFRKCLRPIVDNFFVRYHQERAMRPGEGVDAYLTRLQAFLSTWYTADHATFPQEAQLVQNMILDFPNDLGVRVQCANPTTIVEAASLALLFTSRPGSWSHQTKGTSSGSGSGDPMDLSAMDAMAARIDSMQETLNALIPGRGGCQGGHTRGFVKTRGKLSQGEREHRIRNQLCIACGQAGHWKGDAICSVSGKGNFGGGLSGAKLNMLKMQLGDRALAAHLDALVVQEENKSGNV